MAKILVIEDEATLREALVEWLMLEDYAVIDAADGLAGIEAAVQHLPDLILCDIMMPRMDGYGVLAQLQANKETAHIPLIFTTAKVAPEDIRKGLELGATAYVKKPFTRLELLQVIQNSL
jgi:diguanylate cyclase